MASLSKLRPSGLAIADQPSCHDIQRWRLRDGTPILVRPVIPSDKKHLRAGMARLSATSRRRRFHVAVEQLSESQLRYLTEIDQSVHMAWIAFDLTGQHGLPVGIARCVRLEEDRSLAEVAITVVDSHQGRGLGTLFLTHLGRYVIESDIAAVIAYVHRDNQRMLHLLKALDTEMTSYEPGVLRVAVPVPNDVDRLARSHFGTEMLSLH